MERVCTQKTQFANGKVWWWDAKEVKRGRGVEEKWVSNVWKLDYLD